MESRQIEFQFKGTRNYIQGPDIFNAMIGVGGNATELSNIRFSVHDFVRTPICRIYEGSSKEEINSVQDIRARCQFDVHGISRWLALTQYSGDAASGKRNDYDEARVVSQCRMEGEGVTLVRQSPFTFVETIVSMNKHMHQQLFPEVAGKWIFTRIDLQNGCVAQEKLALQFRHNMNYRLTKSDILADDKKIGDLYFSLVKS
jgi:hypothetical protein